MENTKNVKGTHHSGGTLANNYHLYMYQKSKDLDPQRKTHHGSTHTK